MEPALEHAVSELARVTFAAMPLAEFRARGAGVVVLPGVSPASLLGGVGERALRPVVGPATWTVADLELEHSEVVGREHVVGGGVVIFSIDGEWGGCSSSIRVRCVPMRDLKVLEHGFVLFVVAESILNVYGWVWVSK